MTRAARAGIGAGIGAALLMGAAIAGLALLKSEWFRDRLRQRIIGEAERWSGGRVELASFRFDLRRLTAELGGFVLHGLEPAGAPPLFRSGRIRIGLRVVSALKRDIDIAALVVERPEVNVITAPDGRTNIPRPRTAGGPGAVEQIFRLAVGRYELSHGAFHLDSRRIPLHLSGRGLSAALDYERTGPRYRGTLRVEELRLEAAGEPELPASLRIEAALERDRVEFTRFELAAGKSKLDFSGAIENFRQPRTSGAMDAHIRVADLAGLIRLPLEPRGEIRISGKGFFAGPGSYLLEGRFDAGQIGVSSHGVRVENARLRGALRLEPELLAIGGLEARLLDGEFRGAARLAGFRRLSVEGTAAGIPVASAGRVHASTARIPWNGRVGGRVRLETEIYSARLANTEVRADLTVSPEDGPRPVEGTLTLYYDQKGNRIRFDPSRLATHATQADFSGVLGERLEVDVRTTDLDDLLFAAWAFSENAPDSIPVSLEKGSASFRGVVAGALDSPRIRGQATAVNLRYGKSLFQRAGARVDLARSSLELRAISVERGGARLEGSIDLALAGWKAVDSSRLSGKLTIAGADLGPLAREFGKDAPVEGVAAAAVSLSGTLERPEAEARVQIGRLQLAGESFEKARGRVRLHEGRLEVSGARLETGKARIDVSAVHSFPAGDLSSGELRFELSCDRLALGSLAAARKLLAGADALSEAKLTGALALSKGQPLLRELSGRIALRDLTYRKRQAGSLTASLSSESGRLRMEVSGSLRGAAIRGTGEWRLESDYPGRAQIDFAPVKLSDLRELASAERDLPFDGAFQGRAVVSGPLRDLERTAAEVRIESLELRPRASGRSLPAGVKELFLRNREPVLLRADAKGIHIQSARFTGRDTSLDVLGTFSTRSRNAWNLEIRGGLEMGLISTLYPELVASGRAVLNATVRGTVDQPVFGGRMELDNASLFLSGVPSGIENARGVIFFDRNRATIDHLTAQAGGGQVSLSGFVGIGGPELTYRLQAEASKVRIRYPEGVSTTASASLSLTGTTQRSLLAGTATIERAAFNPRTDLGSLLAESARPVTTPAPANPVLAGMQFDIRVNSSPALEVASSLAKEIQAEADLRLRGSAAKPVLLGRVSVSQGEIQFFGNKYSITRGDVSFYNPARIEPVLDLDLETRVRGVIVNLTFTGPMSKLNMTYRSDPPLQSQEIIALLAVGRAPGSNPTQAGTQTVYSQGMLPAGTDSLIGQAISTPLSSRLQRFFGVSRLKIDPHLTGTEITPQARLTVEQQISRDITLTYVTNLSETKEQLVRVEWDLNRQWSVVAVRDENGTFGIDFLYKKRFR